MALPAEPIIPPSEGKAVNVTFRLPEALLRRVDAAAAVSGHSRSNVLGYLIRWAIDQFEADRQNSARK